MTAPVLFVTGEYPPDAGGVGDYTGRLREALGERGVESRVLTSARPSGQTTEEVSRSVQRWDLPALDSVARAAEPGSIVHVQYQPGAFGLRGEICALPAYLRARRSDLRTVTTFHDVRVPYLFPKAGPVRSLAVRLLARTSSAVIAADASDIAWLGADDRSHLVPIGSNVDREPPFGYDRGAFRAGLGIGEDQSLIVYFGFLNASKGLTTLAQTFTRIAEHRPDARFLLLGGRTGASDPTDAATAERFDSLLTASVRSRLTRAPYLQPPDLSAHLLAADVAVLPFEDGASARRGSLLACLAHGLPVVTTTGPGMTPELAEAVNAAKPGDAEMLAANTLELLRIGSRRAKLARAAERFTESISWATIAEHHEAIYLDVTRPA